MAARNYTSNWVLGPVMVILSACGQSSGGATGNSCVDAGAVNGSCQSLAQQIVDNGGTAGTCTSPPAKFVAVCQAYARCLQCVGD
jgi:hypothetical protein